MASMVICLASVLTYLQCHQSSISAWHDLLPIMFWGKTNALAAVLLWSGGEGKVVDLFLPSPEVYAMLNMVGWFVKAAVWFAVFCWVQVVGYSEGCCYA
ncbi:hypothetical protein LOK49_LG04G02738 [Camellia lanceoleosa]|uniref:Uncharacterized protein n=1 Tax=Camellia lanceoleosa TaxID=1840588 RepID=A0ACC0HUQ5_9ERIC|nr:hypothetical protein LOK49_LG04G02738 [Camellia lanceoleosa]